MHIVFEDHQGFITSLLTTLRTVWPAARPTTLPSKLFLTDDDLILKCNLAWLLTPPESASTEELQLYIAPPETLTILTTGTYTITHPDVRLRYIRKEAFKNRKTRSHTENTISVLLADILTPEGFNQALTMLQAQRA